MEGISGSDPLSPRGLPPGAGAVLGARGTGLAVGGAGRTVTGGGLEFDPRGGVDPDGGGDPRGVSLVSGLRGGGGASCCGSGISVRVGLGPGSKNEQIAPQICTNFFHGSSSDFSLEFSPELATIPVGSVRLNGSFPTY